MTFFRLPTVFFICIQLFQKGCRKKCARDNPQRKYGIWSIHGSWRLQLSNILLLLSLSTRKHMSVASNAIFSNFFKEQSTQKPPTIPFGTVTCTFSDNLSRNSCIPLFFQDIFTSDKSTSLRKAHNKSVCPHTAVRKSPKLIFSVSRAFFVVVVVLVVTQHLDYACVTSENHA